VIASSRKASGDTPSVADQGPCSPRSLVEHAAEEYRESMLKNVRLHREIMAAWRKHGSEIEAEGQE